MENKFFQVINKRALRERILLFFVSILITTLVWMELIFTPLSQKKQDIVNNISSIQNNINSDKLVIKGLEEVAASKSSRKIDESLINNNQILLNLKQKIKDQTVKMISANQMIKVIRDILEKNSNLILIGIENQKPKQIINETEKVVTKKENESTLKNDNVIYKHSVIVKLKGPYTNLVEYLKSLESLRWKFIWTAIKIETDNHPNNNIELTISTLSLNKSLLEF